jgi:hypothetical protein
LRSYLSTPKAREDGADEYAALVRGRNRQPAHREESIEVGGDAFVYRCFGNT